MSASISSTGVDSRSIDGPRTGTARFMPRRSAAATSPSSWTATVAGRRKRHLPRVEGHRAGIDSVRDGRRDLARGSGLDGATLYAFSVENWKRPRPEVEHADDAPEAVPAVASCQTLLDNNIRFQRDRPARRALPPDVQRELEMPHRQTADNTGMLFNIALNYGGRAEIVDAARARDRARARRRRRPRRAPVRRASLHGRPARSRPAHSHQRRDARQQLPAWQIAYARSASPIPVAGLPPSPSARRRSCVPEARPPLRWHHAARCRVASSSSVRA